MEDLASSLHTAKLKLLTQQTTSGIIATTLATLPLLFLLSTVTPAHKLVNWFSAVAILGVMRFMHIFYYKKYPDRAFNSLIWRMLLYIGLATSGLLWGFSVIYLIPLDNLVYIGINSLWVCAIVAGAIGLYSVTKTAYISFSISALLPIIIFFSLQHNTLRDIALGLALFFFYMLISALKLNRLITKNFASVITEQDKNKEISKQKNILRVIADTSEKLLKDSWELAIPELLENLGNTIDVSRIQIFENLQDENFKHITTHSRYKWSSPNAPRYEHDTLSISYQQLNLHKWEKALAAGNAVFGNIDSFPRNEQRLLKSISIQSLIAVPIFVGEKWWGFICFDECRINRDWQPEEINVLKTVAAVIGAAIKRTWTEDRLTYHASHDSLTGLKNRRAFEIHLDKVVKSCAKTLEAHVLCYIDLDRFKVINDTCGHNAGDNLLRQIGNVMKQVVRKNDYVARLGGDEFAILLNNISIDDAKRLADKIQTSIEKFSFRWNDRVFKVGASFGLVAIDANTNNIDKILQTADNACRAVKSSSSSQIRIYRIDDTEMSNKRSDSQSYVNINHALENNEFTLLFQPITTLNNINGEWDHYEILIRMFNENDSLITPNRFLPTAERYNLINKIDRWVFKACVKKLSEHQELYEKINILSINISAATLCEPQFLRFVISEFENSSVPAEKICFEVTETVAVSNLPEANNFISNLRKLGCKFALDDFGTGFSSLEILKHLPVDFVKIDGIFIREIDTNPVDYEMVASLHRIAKLMHIQTIAEYVESEAILNTLKDIGIDYVQGYAINSPMTLNEVLEQDSLQSSILKFAG